MLPSIHTDHSPPPSHPATVAPNRNVIPDAALRSYRLSIFAQNPATTLLPDPAKVEALR